MGVVNQVRESHVKGTVPPLHYPATFGMIAGGVDPLDPQHLASLAKNEDMKALPWSVTKTELVPCRATISRVYTRAQTSAD
jgi:hypothetical protein